MEQLIEAFGIDAKLIVVQIINFLILLGLLSYFLYKPVLKMLADREAKIKQGIADAEAAAVAKATADEDKKAVLAAAQKEAEETALRAKEHADAKGSEITKTAEMKAENMIQDAKIKGVEIENQARKNSEEEIAKLAVLAAEKVLQQKAS